MAIQFEVTVDSNMLAQYYAIREDCFRKELGLAKFDGSEDEWDRVSHLLIARDGDRCLGGMRITGSLPVAHTPLPVEKEGLPVRDLLLELGLPEGGYCQWSRLAMGAEYRTPQLLQQFCNAMIVESKQLGFDYSFIVAGMNRARLYKRLYASLGYRYDILTQVRIPVEDGFDGLPHLLSIGYLGNAVGSQGIEVLKQVA